MHIDLGEIGGAEVQAQAEFRQGVGQPGRFLGVQAVGGVRPARLQPHLQAMGVAEGGELGLVGRREGQQVAEYQHGDAVAHGDLDLGQAVGDGEPAHQGAQGREQVGDGLRQDLAGTHVGDVAGAPFVEAHQHPALLRHQAHADAGPVAVAPGRAVDGGEDHLRLQPPDMPQGVLQHPLLGGGLGVGIQVLHGAAAAHPEVGAARRHALGAGAEDAAHLGLLEGRLLAIDRVLHLLPGRAPSMKTVLPSTWATPRPS